MKLHKFSLLLLSLLSWHLGNAQLITNGTETKINSTITNSQINAAIAMDSLGAAVAVWESFESGNYYKVRAQRYDLAGAPAGSEIEIASSVSGDRRLPDVAKGAGGMYAIVWMSDGEDGDGWGIYGSLFNADGSAIATGFQINPTNTGNQKNPRVAMDEDGDFIVVWTEESADGSESGVYGRRYSNLAIAQGGRFRVNSTTAGYQGHPAVACDLDGNFVVAWQSNGQDGSLHGIYAQRYNDTGATVGSETLVNTTTTNNQIEPDVSMNTDGDYIIVWSSYDQDGDNEGVCLQRFNSDGTTNGGEVIVNTTTSDAQTRPAVALGANDDYIVVWSSYGIDGSFMGVYLQAYNANGTANGAETQVNTRTNDFQQNPDIALYNSCTDNVMVVWQDGLRNSSSTNDGDDYGIYFQRFDASVDTEAPTVNCSDPTIYLDGSGNATITASDVFDTGTDNCSSESYLMSTGQIDVSSFTCSEIGSNTVTLTVMDEAGNSADCTSTVMVQDTVAPMAVCRDINVYLLVDGTATIVAGDVDDGSTDNCSVSNLEFDTGSISAIYTCTDIGINTVTLSVTDASSNNDQCTAEVNVRDTITPMALCQDLSVYLDGTGLTTISASEVDNSSSDICSVSLGIDVSTFTCSEVGANTVTLTATDPSLNTDQCTATVTVLDTITPVAVCQNLTVFLATNGLAEIAANDVDGGSTDNCSLSYAVDTGSFACTDLGANTVTLTVTDPGSNSAMCTATVTVQDTTAPVAVCQDLTVQLDGSGNATIVASEVDNGSVDNCSVGLGLDVSTFTCSDVGANTVTLTVTDPSTNSAQCTAAVTVEDVDMPTAVCQDLMVQLDGSGNATIVASEVDNGSSDGCSSGGLGLTLDVSSFTCSDVGANTVTLTVTDPSTNSAQCTSTVTVQDTTAPVAVCQDLTVQLDGSGMVSIMASEVDDGSADNCSVGLGLDVSTFTCSDVGANTVTLTVTDPSTNSAQCTSTVTVQDTTAPVAVCQDLTVQLDGSGMVSIMASEVDDGSVDNCSVGLGLDVSSFTCSDVGANMVTLTVTDPSTNSAQCTATVTVEDVDAPVAVCQDLTVQLDGSGNATIVASEVDNGSSDGCSSGGLGLTLDVSSFTCSDVGANTVTLTVTDPSTNSAQCTSTVTVQDTTAPVAVCQDLTVQLDGSGNATIVASEVDNGSADNCSVGLGLDVSSFTCSDVGANTVTLTVTDPSTNSAQCTSTVTVQDTTAPVAVCQDITVNLDGSGNATITVSQVDDGSSDNCSVSLGVDISSFNCSDLGANTVTLTVTDPSTNSSQCTSTVTVQDVEDPVAVCQDITVNLDGSGNASIMASQIDNGSTDNCPVSLGLDMSSFTCLNLGGNTVTLTVADASMNSDQCTATVTIEDNVDPVPVCQNITVQLDVNNMASLNPSDIYQSGSDNCGTVNLISVSSNAFDCDDLGTNTITLTVNDGNGNTGTCDAVVTIADDINPCCATPMAVCQNFTAVLNTNGDFTLSPSDIDAGSTFECGLQLMTITPVTFDCTNLGSNNVTLSITDVNGDSDQCSATVTVEDNTPPNPICQNLTVQLDASGNASITAAQLDNGTTDNCTFTLSLDINSFTCNEVGSNTVTVTATDQSSNNNQCTSTVTVEDEVEPIANCQNVTIELNAGGQASVSASEVNNNSTDACGIGLLSLDITDFDCDDVGQNSVILTVTDNNNNSSTCSATVTVEDNIAPEVICQDISVQLNSEGQITISPNDIFSSSSDNCGQVVLVSVDPDELACPDIGDNSVTLTAEDENGNTGTCEAIVTVEVFITISDIIVTAENCDDEDGSIEIIASALGGQLAYSIDGGGSWQLVSLFEELSTGTYEIAVRAYNTFNCIEFGGSVTLGGTGSMETWYRDFDGDGYSNGLTVESCSQPAGYYLAGDLIATSGDCNDYNPNAFPGQTWWKDLDGDGYGDGIFFVNCSQPAGLYPASALISTTGDCDDDDETIYPGATEICNGVDDDCNGQIDDGVMGGQTFVGNVLLNSQSDVDAWAACYSKIEGNLSIKNSGVTDLSPLENLEEVTGTLIIQSTGLTDLNGLDSLETIGDILQIRSNNSLNALTGLGGVTSVGSHLRVYYNDSLTDCCPIYDLLNTPGSIGGSIAILRNETGCDNLSEINTNCN